MVRVSHSERERDYAAREKEWREQDSLRGAALKDRPRDEPVVDRRDIPVVDRNGDGVIDDRDR